MILHDASWAPSPRRVRVYLAEKGIEVERRAVDLRANEQLSDGYLAVNPRGAVPALELADGEVITESSAICRYFEALYPEPPLFGATPLDIARIESWSRRIDSDGYGAVVYVLRNTAPGFADRGLSGDWPPIAQIPALAQRGEIMWQYFLRALDAQLDGRDWIAADRYSFADISALVAIDFGAGITKRDLPDTLTNLLRWHEAASARPSAVA